MENEDEREHRIASAVVRRHLVDSDSGDSGDSIDSSDDDVGPMGVPPTRIGPLSSTVGGAGSSGTSTGVDNTSDVGGCKTTDDSAQSPPRAGKKLIWFRGDVLLGEKGMAGFFRPEMRNELDDFYPQWQNVPTANMLRIWGKFLEQYSLGKYDHDFVYNKFMAQNGEKYRKFLHDLKKKQMDDYKVADVEELLHKPKPIFMKSSKVWRKYVRWLSTPAQRSRSEINAKNRAKRKGSHGFGRTGAVQRLDNMEKEGKKPSMMAVFVDVNIRKDEKKNPTGVVNHEEMQECIEEYRKKHEETHPGVNPEEEELDLELWKSTDGNARRVSKGRVLGIGSCRQAASIFSPVINVGGSSAQVDAQLEELRCKHEEEVAIRQQMAEEAKRKYEEKVKHRRKLEAHVAGCFKH